MYAINFSPKFCNFFEHHTEFYLFVVNVYLCPTWKSAFVDWLIELALVSCATVFLLSCHTMLLHKKEEEEWALHDTTKIAIRETKLASLFSRYFHLIISLAWTSVPGGASGETYPRSNAKLISSMLCLLWYNSEIWALDYRVASVRSGDYM